SVPRPLDLEGTGRLAAVRVAQVRRDAAELALELFERVEGIAAMQAGDRRVQAAAGDEHQRKAGADFLVVDPDGPPFVKQHASLLRLRPEAARRRGHRRCRRTGLQHLASLRIHRVLPDDAAPARDGSRYAASIRIIARRRPVSFVSTLKILFRRYLRLSSA